MSLFYYTQPGDISKNTISYQNSDNSLLLSNTYKANVTVFYTLFGDISYSLSVR